MDLANQIRADKEALLKELEAHKDKFVNDTAVKKEIMVASVPIETLRKREEEMEQSRLKNAQQELDRFRMREADLAIRENAARKRVQEIEVSILSPPQRDFKFQLTLNSSFLFVGRKFRVIS